MSLDYILVSQLNDGREIVLDPDQKGWANKDILNQTRIWSLVPKEQNGMPVVTVTVPEKGKPVYKSRVYGKLQTDISFRAYAVGYKLGRRTHWVWVMPGGNIEVGDDPIYADLLLRRMAGQND